MNEKIFDIILLFIPVIAAIITGFIIPYLKTKISATQMDEISKWVVKAVQAAEVMFDSPQSGTEKKEYVINFIDNMFNSKKEVISKQQIEILLEAAWKQMTEA